MANAAAEDAGLAAQAGGGAPELLAQVREIAAADVGEFDVLEVVPEALVERVELGRVAGQLDEPQPPGGARRKEVLDRLGAMDGGAIPEDQQLAGEVREQVLQEAHHVSTPDRLVLHLQQQLPGAGHGADDGEMVTGQAHAQRGRLSPWGIRPHRSG